MMRCFKFVVVFILVPILATALISAKSKSAVKVFRVSGRAKYLRVDEVSWEKIKAGERLFSGDSIRTYEDANVEIAFDAWKKNVVSIKPNTHVVLKLYDEEKIELIDGEVFSLVKKIPRGSHFEIRTPTAVCGARGTGWGANANKDRTIVSAYEDDSYAKGFNEDGTVMEDNLIVKEGYRTTVKRFEKPSELARISDEDYEKWNKWKEGLTERVGSGISQMQAIRKKMNIPRRQSRIEELEDEDRLRDLERRGAGGGEAKKETTVSSGDNN